MNSVGFHIRFFRCPVNLSGTPGVILSGEPNGPKPQGTIMIKALSAVAIAAFIATALSVLPSFAPSVEASAPNTLAKADKLAIRQPGSACAEQNWPNIEASCLRRTDLKVPVSQVRLVTTDRR